MRTESGLLIPIVGPREPVRISGLDRIDDDGADGGNVTGEVQEEPLGVVFDMTYRGLTDKYLETLGHFLARTYKDGMESCASQAGCSVEFESLTIKREGRLLEGVMTFRRVEGVEKT